MSTSDFDGDGFEDLVAGVVRDDPRGILSAGSVSVLYGSPKGISTRNQLWTQDSPEIEDTAEDGDTFGWAVAAGDFNGDGFADLAVGVPGEDLGGAGNAGAVNVLYGSASGLSPAGNQFWHQDSPGVEGEAEFFDTFGSALAAGDFDGDGFADLAIGAPNEDVHGGGGFGSHGALNVLYGSTSGLSASGNQYWHQGSPGIKEAPDIGDFFATSLRAADYNGDGFMDLVVGVPGELLGFAGAINVLYGSASGLSARDNQLWHQDRRGVEGDGAQDGDYFGIDLASDDFNGDGFADVAVGVWGEGGYGATNVFYGSATGLTAQGSQFWHQNVRGIEDYGEVNDAFGFRVSAGDYNNDGFADLAVGVPFETFPDDRYPRQGAGAVNVLYGSRSGLVAKGSQFWHQDSSGIADKIETGDVFGQALGSGDYNNDGFIDLAIGVPQEDIGLFHDFSGDQGILHVLYRTAAGLSSIGSQVWHRDTPGIKGRAKDGTWFAWSLSGR